MTGKRLSANHSSSPGSIVLCCITLWNRNAFFRVTGVGFVNEGLDNWTCTPEKWGKNLHQSISFIFCVCVFFWELDLFSNNKCGIAVCNLSQCWFDKWNTWNYSKGKNICSKFLTHFNLRSAHCKGLRSDIIRGLSRARGAFDPSWLGIRKPLARPLLAKMVPPMPA